MRSNRDKALLESELGIGSGSARSATRDSRARALNPVSAADIPAEPNEQGHEHLTGPRRVGHSGQKSPDGSEPDGRQHEDHPKRRQDRPAVHIEQDEKERYQHYMNRQDEERIPGGFTQINDPAVHRR